MSARFRDDALAGDPVADFDAVVLAGGRATRLSGIDKPGIELGGRPLVDYAVAAAAAARRLILVGPPRAALTQAIVVREDPPGAGPVPAVAAGLTQVEAAWAALLAADLPFLRPAHVDALRAAAYGDRGAVAVDAGGREQWLIGLWPTVRLRDALETYDGSSLRGLLGPLNPRRVALQTGEQTAEEIPPPWLDCDTMADITSAKEWM